MNEKEYKRLLIETIEIGEYELKKELLPLIKVCNISFEKTGTYAYKGVWNQCKEHIHISIVPSRLNDLKKHQNYIRKVCRDIYQVNEEYHLSDILFKPGILNDYEEATQEIVFENIQSQVIEEIQSAKYIIWVAMAWFTDPIIYRELVKKKNEGISIEIVLDDNEKNRNAEFDIEKSFNIHWVTIKSLFNNIMHDKFCIIDLYTVVHGTYNWTKAANYNKETISIDKNRETAEAFAERNYKH